MTMAAQIKSRMKAQPVANNNAKGTKLTAGANVCLLYLYYFYFLSFVPP